MNNYDIIIIQLEKSKFKEMDNYTYVTNSKETVKEFIKELNKNKVTIFLRFGWCGCLFFFIGMAVTMAMALSNNFSLIFIGPLFFVLGIVMMCIWGIKLSGWQQKCNKIKDKFTNKFKNFYILTDVTPISYRRTKHGGTRAHRNWQSSKYKLTPINMVNQGLMQMNNMMGMNLNPVLLNNINPNINMVQQHFNPNMNQQHFNPNMVQQHFNPSMNQQQFNPNMNQQQFNPNPQFNPNNNPQFNQNNNLQNEIVKPKFNPYNNPQFNVKNNEFNPNNNPKFNPNNNPKFNPNNIPQFNPNMNQQQPNFKMNAKPNNNVEQINFNNNNNIPIQTFKLDKQNIQPLPEDEDDLKKKKF